MTAPAADVLDTRSAAPAPALGRSVMLVDDTEMLRSLVARHLRRTGRYQVVAEAGNGLEALEAAQQTRPDLVLLDLQMDGMDGMTALPLLRRHLPHARIVIFTGHDYQALWPRLQAAGADSAVGKGTRLSDVVAHLDTLA